MRRFKFSLQAVLMLREKTLEDERLELAKVVAALNKQKAIIEELKAQLLNLKENINNFMEVDFNPVLISNYTSYIIKVENEILSEEQKLKLIDKDFINQKNKVKDAYIQVKTLEKLKEKQKERYQKEVLFEEIKTLDDIVNSRKRA